MSDDVDGGAKSIFLRAAEIDSSAERSAYLDAACGSDVALRAEVVGLLAAAEDAGSFMQVPAVALSSTGAHSPISENLGTEVGPYKLLEQIGEGGFGRVFVAEQLRPVRRKVALKIIKPGMDTGDVIARFEAERQALALMDHPNIAKVLDAGATDSGRPFFVMELIRGIPITEYCDQHFLPPRQRLGLFRALCHAIQHAHQKGVIHRDIKPTNVLVTSHDGQPVVKVIDFGVAKALNQRLTERTVYTQFAQMIGTPLYMSPEQAEMSGLDIDTRADIYSLGVLLYELLTGTLPFDRERLKAAALDEVRRIIREEDPPKPSTRISQSGARLASIAALRKTEPAKLSKLVRGDLDWIVMKCLEKDRTRRYESASGLARDVERYLDDEPVEACPPTAVYQLRKFAQKHHAAITTAGAIIALLIVGIVASSWQAIRASRAKQQAIEERDEKETARREALASAQRARKAVESERHATAVAQRNLYVARINLVDKALKAGNLAAAERLLSHYEPGTGLETLRGFEWFHWRSVCNTLCVERQRNDLWGFLAISPNGQTVAMSPFYPQSPTPGELFLWDPQTDLRRKLDSRAWGSMAFSRDGQRLVTGGFLHSAIAVWEVEKGAKLTEIPLELTANDHLPSVAFFNSDQQVVAPVRNQVVFWDAATGKQQRTLGAYSAKILAMALSADGESLAAGYEDGDLQIWNPHSGETLKRFKAHDAGVRSVLFVPHSNQLVTADGTTSVKVWNLADSKWPTTELKGEGFRLAVSPDGQTLLAGETNGLLHAMDLTTGDRFVHAQISTLMGLEFFPDGKKFAACGGSLSSGIWKIGRPGARAALDHALVRDLIFTADSQILASITGGLSFVPDELSAWLADGCPPQADVVATGPWKTGGTIKTWNTRTGELLRSLHGKSSSERTFVFASDGKPLASFSLVSGKSESLAPQGDLRLSANHAGLVLSDSSPPGAASVSLTGQPVQDARFSPDGKLVAASLGGRGPEQGKVGLINLWRVPSGRPIKTLAGHTDLVWSVDFSPDNATLASASEDRTVRLWDIQTGEEKAAFNYADGVRQVKFSPDGRVLVSATDKQVRLLQAPSDADLQRQN